MLAFHFVLSCIKRRYENHYNYFAKKILMNRSNSYFHRLKYVYLNLQKKYIYMHIYRDINFQKRFKNQMQLQSRLFFFNEAR